MLRKWFIKQLDKLGLESSNLKSEAELKGYFLENGQSEKIILPNELCQDGEWYIKKWFFKKGQMVNPGDIVGAVENDKQMFEFESYVGGRLNYFKQIGQKVEGNSVLAEITGDKKKKHAK